MREIQISKGYIVQVDDEDYEYLCKQKWHAKEHSGGLVYACGKQWIPETKKSLNIKMHRVIMKLTDPKVVIDHVDGNGLNNRKSNLRICTRKENQLNRQGKNGKWKGVELVEKTNHWTAFATDSNGKKINLGTFETGEKAALAYNEYAIANHGKFAKINITSQLG